MMTITPKAPAGGKPDVPAPSVTYAAVPLGGVLRAQVFKELRQGAIFVGAVLLLLALITLMAGMASYLSDSRIQPEYRINILAAEPVLSYCLMGCAVVGFGLGLIQPYYDRSFDLWAYLIHRPVPRQTLFFGRVLAGMILYAIAAGLPILVLLVVAATHWGGHFFHWRLTLPIAADFLLGLVYYFAGLLVMSRKASVFGSRLIPVVTALVCSGAIVVVPAFWQAALIEAGTCGLLLLAGLGAQVSHGYELRSPRVTRWATFAVLFLSFSALVAAMHEPMTGFVEWRIEEAARLVPRAADNIKRTITSYTILPEGNVAQAVYRRPIPDGSGMPLNDPAEYYTYTRMTGEGPPLDAHATYEALQNPENTAAFFQLANERVQSHYFNTGNIVYHSVYKYEDGPPVAGRWAETWFYLPAVGLFYGYDQQTGAYLGTLGAAGFAAPGAPNVPATLGGSSNLDLLLSSRGIYRANYEMHTFMPVIEYPADEQVLNVQPMSNPGPPRPGLAPEWYLARTQTHLLIYHGTVGAPPEVPMKLILTLPLARSPEMRDIHVRRWERAQRWSLWYEPSRDPMSDNTVEIFDDAGTRVAHFDVPQRYAIDPPYTEPPGMQRLEQQYIFGQGITDGITGMPVVMALRQMKLAQNRDRIIDPFPFTGGWYMAGVLPMLAAGAVGMGFLARRYGVRHLWLWVISAAVFGPMMLLMLATTRFLPRMLTCPSCGKGRFPDQPLCRRCRTPFPATGPAPTDIFA